MLLLGRLNIYNTGDMQMLFRAALLGVEAHVAHQGSPDHYENMQTVSVTAAKA